MNRRPVEFTIKPHAPRRKRLAAVLLVVGLPLAGWGLFDYGRSRAGFDSTKAADERAHLQRQIEVLADGNAQLRQELLNVEHAAQIDQQSYDKVSGGFKSLQNEIAELKEEVALYRGVVSQAEAVKGLQVQNFQLARNTQEHGYSYKLVLTQVISSARLTSGTMRIYVEGLQEGTQKRLPLTGLGQQQDAMRFRFTYFQKAEGDVVLPPGFVPTRVLVRLTTEQPAQQEVEQTFPWPADKR